MMGSGNPGEPVSLSLLAQSGEQGLARLRDLVRTLEQLNDCISGPQPKPDSAKTATSGSGLLLDTLAGQEQQRNAAMADLDAEIGRLALAVGAPTNSEPMLSGAQLQQAVAQRRY